MAPVAVERVQVETPALTHYKEAFNAGPRSYNAEKEIKGTKGQPPAKYPNYLPVWEFETYPPLEPYTHQEHGKDADPTFPDLMQGANVTDLTGNIGAEVHGIQLSTMSDRAKDQLALFVAQKKVVAFRDQDFADLDIQDAKDFGAYFGRHHVHQTSGAPKGHPEIHLVHRGAGDTMARDFFANRTNSITWHSDITFEEQPPGTTFLYTLDAPSAGGDTLFANMAEAYNRLSSTFQQRLHGLYAEHSGVEQAAASRVRGGQVRREPVTNVHPIIRTHPATGEKAIFVNQQFTRRIVGMKQEESEWLLKFLYDHIALSQDLQCRVKWAPNTVVVWDNRITGHSAVLDWQDGQRRHIARVTPQAERPYQTPFVEPATQ